MHPTNKTQLRKHMIALRNKLTPEEIKLYSGAIFKKLEKLPQFVSANNIMIYWSIKNEVDTLDFKEKWRTKKNLYLPVIDGNDILACRYNENESVHKTGKFQIPEPRNTPVFPPQDLDLIIVPGVAFDRTNFRLGYGKGYYDRFLSQTETYKVGICFDFQVVEKIKNDPWDIPLDLILTNEQV